MALWVGPINMLLTPEQRQGVKYMITVKTVEKSD